MKPVILLCLAVLAPAAPAQSCPAATPAWRGAVLAHANALRAEGGPCGEGSESGVFDAGPALRWSAALEAMTLRQAHWLSQRGVLEHTGRHGENLAARALAAGYTFRTVAENLASGPRTAAAVLAGWRGSDSHCVNLLSPHVQELALVCVPGPGGPWWAMTLAAPLAPADQPPPMTPPPRQTSPSYSTADWPGVTAH